MSYTIMTIVGNQIVGRNTDATWSDVLDFATETDSHGQSWYEELWIDHAFIEQVRDNGEAVRRHHDGVGVVIRVAFANPAPLTLRKTGDVL